MSPRQPYPLRTSTRGYCNRCNHFPLRCFHLTFENSNALHYLESLKRSCTRSLHAFFFCIFDWFCSMREKTARNHALLARTISLCLKCGWHHCIASYLDIYYLFWCLFNTAEWKTEPQNNNNNNNNNIIIMHAVIIIHYFSFIFCDFSVQHVD